jgi:hypothetical protein
MVLDFRVKCETGSWLGTLFWALKNYASVRSSQLLASLVYVLQIRWGEGGMDRTCEDRVGGLGNLNLKNYRDVRFCEEHTGMSEKNRRIIMSIETV